MSFKMSRKQYADMFGPTVGDAVRLADTDLFIEIEQDFTTYGDEVKFGEEKSSVMGWDSILLRQEVKQQILFLRMPSSWIIRGYTKQILV